MKKLLIVTLIFGVPYSVHALTQEIPEYQVPTCCVADEVNGCLHYYCMGDEYTACEECTTPGATPEYNGSYRPCGSLAGYLDTSFGKCVTPAIAIFCSEGQYEKDDTCVDCPTPGTSVSGAEAITDCYLPAGTTGSDTTGTYTYTDKCYYSKSGGSTGGWEIVDPTPVRPGDFELLP